MTGPTVPVDPITDKIVSGTAGAELIDATYTGDNDGDLVDNNDGNPNSETCDDDSIVAGGGNDTINGGAGNDTMLGQGGDDKFVLTGDNPGNDSIVGGETDETMGDCIDMSSLTTGVNVDMSAGTGESGTITFGAAGAVSGITGNGGTNFTPTDLFGSATTDGGNGIYQSSDPGNSGYSAMEHVQVDGKDYIVHAGNTGFEFWTMDPNSGQLTLEDTISRSGDLQTNGFMSNLDIVTMNGETYAYCPNIYYTTILKYDSQAGAWAKIADLGSEITTPAGTIGANYGPSVVNMAPDGTVMSYSVLNGGGAGRIVTIEMDPNTGLPDTSTMKSFGPPSGVGTVQSVQVVNTDAGTLIITNDGNDAYRIWDTNADGSATGTYTQINTNTSGGLLDALNGIRKEPFVDANGNLIIAGGHDTGTSGEADGGTIVIYDPTTKSVVKTIANGYLNGEANYTVDADGFIYITTTSSSGGGALTRPFTIVLDPSTNYTVVASGYDNDGGYNSAHMQQIAGGTTYYGAENNLIVTSTTGQNFLIQSRTAGNNTGWISSATSELGEATINGGGTGAGTGTTTFEEIECMALTEHDDTLTGSEGDEHIEAGGGNDLIATGGGNDTVDGGTGDDTIGGGDGNDSIDGGDGADSLIGGAGKDTITGGEGADTIDGGDGDDDIAVGAGDSVTGGSGDDEFTVDPTLTGNSPITIVGGETGEEDLIDPTNNPDGRVGDTLDLRGLTDVVVTYDPTDPDQESGTASYTNNLGQTVTINFSEIENVLIDDNSDGVVDGEDYAEYMTAGYNDTDGPNDGGGDVIGQTDDSIRGNGGNDIIDADAGNDTVDGGADNDIIFGNLGDDSIMGGTGTDYIEGNMGADTLDSGAGDDTLLIGDGDVAKGGSGDELFQIDTTEINTTGTSTTPITVDGGIDGTDGYPDDGNNGDNGDILDLSALSKGVDITFGTNPEGGSVDGLDADATPDLTFFEIENVVATANDDTIDGSAATGPLNIDAGEGADTIALGGGDDTINLGDKDGDADVVAITDGDGDNTLTGVDGPVLNPDGVTYTGTDTLDVSGLTDANGAPIDTSDVQIVTDPVLGTTLTFPDGTSITFPELQAPGTDPTDPATGSWLEALGIPAPSTDPDYIVRGTSGGDLIDGTYVDPTDGDMVDNNDGNPTNPGTAGGNNDSILAGAGNDSVYAGSGDDTVCGDDGDDLIYGDSAYDDTNTSTTFSGSGTPIYLFEVTPSGTIDNSTTVMDFDMISGPQVHYIQNGNIGGWWYVNGSNPANDLIIDDLEVTGAARGGEVYMADGTLAAEGYPASFTSIFAVNVNGETKFYAGFGSATAGGRYSASDDMIASGEAPSKIVFDGTNYDTWGGYSFHVNSLVDGTVTMSGGGRRSLGYGRLGDWRTWHGRFVDLGPG